MCKMSRVIEIQKNKSLRLENVLVNCILNIAGIGDENTEEQDDSDQPFSLELEIQKMENEIRVKGASAVGPLIQYSGTDSECEDLQMRISLMIQADRFINKINYPYKMESVIQLKNCYYTRFIGLEEDINYAYQKIEVVAYEDDVVLKGNSYTIFLESNVDGTITADIFMERKDA